MQNNRYMLFLNVVYIVYRHSTKAQHYSHPRVVTDAFVLLVQSYVLTILENICTSEPARCNIH